MDMIFTIGIFTSLFFFILLQNKKNKALPDKILALWMLIISIHLSSTYAYTSGLWSIYPHLIGITAPLPLIYGPLLYLYVAYSLQNKSAIAPKDYLHFIPVLSAYGYLSSFYFFYSAEEKKLVDQGIISDFELFSNVLVVAIIVSSISYAVYAQQLLKKYKTLLDNNFSNTDRINLTWLKSFIWGVASIFISVAIILIIKESIEQSIPFNPDFIFYTLIVFAILSLGYFGIRHQNIFTDNEIVEYNHASNSTYKKSSLKEDVAIKKHAELVNLMRVEKPYLASNITLNMLANQLDVPVHHLSQIINQFEGQNFNEFINNYRVEEFIERASKDTHFSYLALALDSGFNSKSTFNSVFRKHKGVTPSQYLSSIK